MSNSNLFMKSGFVRAPLQNGVGRYVCQLQRIVLKFCKSHGSSRGLRYILVIFIFNQLRLHTVSRIQQGRQKEPCAKTFRFPTHCLIFEACCEIMPRFITFN